MNKMSGNMADTGIRKTSSAAKIALAAIGASALAGTAVVIALDRVMKKVFVTDEWPDEEWSNDDWADEELDH